MIQIALVITLKNGITASQYLMTSKNTSEDKTDKSSTDIDWAEQNKMLRELRWKQRGQPVKTVWWSI